MGSVMSQDEVDALLKGVETDEVSEKMWMRSMIQKK